MRLSLIADNTGFAHSTLSLKHDPVKPVLIVLNIIYVIIRIVKYASFGKYDLINSCICWGLTYYSYQGICIDYADQAGWSKGSSGAALSGGSSLDLLAFALLVQFGSLFSGRVWYGLIAIPVVLAYKTYTTVRGALGGMFGTEKSSAAAEETETNKGNERTQKRAEKRKTK